MLRESLPKSAEEASTMQVSKRSPNFSSMEVRGRYCYPGVVKCSDTAETKATAEAWDSLWTMDHSYRDSYRSPLLSMASTVPRSRKSVCR